jgi:hypothetical protein
MHARIVDSWVTAIGLNPSEYGTHSMRRTKASLIDLPPDEKLACRAVAAWLHKLESTVRYLGIEVDDALEMA